MQRHPLHKRSARRRTQHVTIFVDTFQTPPEIQFVINCQSAFYITFSTGTSSSCGGCSLQDIETTVFGTPRFLFPAPYPASCVVLAASCSIGSCVDSVLNCARACCRIGSCVDSALSTTAALDLWNPRKLGYVCEKFQLTNSLYPRVELYRARE